MRYGVVICPKCGRARGVDLGNRTVECPQCGKRHQISKLRVMAEADTPAELSQMVAAVATSVKKGNQAFQSDLQRYGGGDEQEPPKDRFDAIARKLKGAGDKRSRTVLAVQLLSGASPFSLDDLEKVFGYARMNGARESLEALLKSGLVYEPRPGVYLFL